MLTQATISNEVISVDVKRDLGKLIQGCVAKIRKAYTETKQVPAALLKEMSDIVFITGMRVEFITGADTDAWMFSPMMYGHGGTSWNSFDVSITMKSKDGIKYAGTVDLVNLKVSGDLTKEMTFRSYFGLGLFDNGFSDEEITSLILHEIGHGFNTFVTLGDYIYLNYMLSDGIDILLGNKRNEFNLEILDHTWVEKNLSKEEREQFVNNPSPGNARRAILSTWKKSPRHHLFANNLTAHHREEQMADMFATRLGYGRALVTGLDKLFTHYGYEKDTRSTWLGNLVRIAAMITFIPITLMYIMVVSGTDSLNTGDRYDNPKERMYKVRKDLITQLKLTKNKEYAKTLQSDIDVIDEILKQYMIGKDAFDVLALLFSPNRRREQQLKTHEETLENLLNNDLFVTAQRFKS